jgi:hypothetical protein
MFDPLSRSSFIYERQGLHGFRIYSSGSAETGEIGLKYRRAAGQEESEPPPPFLGTYFARKGARS